MINRASSETKGLVILDKDSTLIISAFHSNCGGQTSGAENVWLISQPYLKSVVDTFCQSTPNAVWEKKISIADWNRIIKKAGYNGETADPSIFNFYQKSRSDDYVAGSFAVPLTTIRTEFNLRSTFFSLFFDGDSMMFRGKGYGHGVGLCQEGAMEMARKGFDFSRIINYYYSGVMISDIKNAVIMNPENTNLPSLTLRR